MKNSTKSVVEKLNFKKYQTRLIMQKPEDVNDFDSVDYDKEIKNDQYDLVFIFIYTIEEFNHYVKEAVDKNLIKDNGYLYFAYPKKGNPKYEQYIERDELYNEKHYNEEGYIPNSNLKFSRMVSLNDVFTIVGMKATKPKNTTTKKASQRVDDYVEKVEDIRNYLQKNDALLTFYNELTPGYQKDWARFVFSAKREATREKRLVQMEEVLGKGYKSMDLYRQQRN
ncbi:YdeI/OmpD-associated family protein [Ornithinibacillus halophilus]|uniref:Bacteriocin-protection, YdeI or OmpD-Associated n=1 Tax=Ornithinibacillus halophilus TaxID=930117 RepID=A0A1M5G481_9BACI|nr:YdeI/OmpD-associated family protein [Ornithinibacillus halophilus]SHF98610.1 Bacteriocin-protection, YdeI or OmpD-Associated [Ornithinibacillus halophilus]